MVSVEPIEGGCVSQKEFVRNMVALEVFTNRSGARFVRELCDLANGRKRWNLALRLHKDIYAEQLCDHFLLGHTLHHTSIF